jgi:hypothetical protein
LPGGGPEGFREVVEIAGRELGQIMSDVRNVLREENAESYDVGVMLSRLSLCLRAVTASTAGLSAAMLEYRQVYATELIRVVPIVAGMIETVRRRPSWNDLPAPEVRRTVTELAGKLARWDGGSDAWCQEARIKAEEVFASFGAVEQTLIPTPDAGEPPVSTSEEIVAQLRELRSRLYQLFLARDLGNAEKGQMLLIEDCRRHVGPLHELTLAVRNDLALTLLYQGRGDIAADRAYDVSADAERAWGDRDPATAREEVRTLFILMATKEFDECLRFSQKLDWLAQANPDELDPDLAETRRELLKMTRPG